MSFYLLHQSVFAGDPHSVRMMRHMEPPLVSGGLPRGNCF
jgi:hypothetical protein